MTDGWYNVSSPNFSKDGKYLVFVSARTFNPTYSSTEWNHVYNNMNKIYILPLTQDATIPFAPENDNPKAPQQTPTTRETQEIRSNERASEKNTTIRISPTGLSNYQSQQEITTICI